MMSLREYERDSIRGFVQECANQELIKGRVLDFGAGQQPYKAIVEKAGGEYVPYDRPSFPGSVVSEITGPAEPLVSPLAWDTILCNQVVQYHPNVTRLLHEFRWSLKNGGHLLMTGPTNWPLVEKEDLQRFTPAGIERLLNATNFKEIEVRERAAVFHEGESWCLGWSAVASA